MKHTDFMRAFLRLHDFYGSRNDSRLENRTRVYWEYFESVKDPERFSKAIQIFLQESSSTFFPPLAAIIAVMPADPNSREPLDPADRVSEEWLQNLQSQIEQVGHPDSDGQESE